MVPDADLVTSLKEAIDKECKMRDAANKLLGLSKNNKQSMEASKGVCVCCCVWLLGVVIVPFPTVYVHCVKLNVHVIRHS